MTIALINVQHPSLHLKVVRFEMDGIMRVAYRERYMCPNHRGEVFLSAQWSIDYFGHLLSDQGAPYLDLCRPKR